MERAADEKGYYVSREMANGFLASEKRVNRFLGLGFLCGALTGIPIILFENQPAMKLLGAAGIDLKTHFRYSGWRLLMLALAFLAVTILLGNVPL